MEVKIVRCSQPCNQSEELAISKIKNQLESIPGDGLCVLMNNLYFCPQNDTQPLEIDLIVLCPFGFYVIETKHWNNSYINENHDLFSYHASLIQRKTKAVVNKLRKTFSDIEYVDALIITTRPDSELEKKGVHNIEGQTIVPVNKFKDYIKSKNNYQKVYEKALIEACARSLNHRSNLVLKNPLKNLGNYKNLNPINKSQNGFRTIYKAQDKKSNKSVILYLYDYTNESFENFEELAEREARIIRDLQKYDWVPLICETFNDVKGWEGELKIFSIIDPNLPTLAKRANDQNWNFINRLEFTKNCLEALQEFHNAHDQEKLVHRKLSPEVIYVRNDNKPIFTGFDFTKVPGNLSISSEIQLTDYEKQYAAPEIIEKGLQYAEQLSDVFSICKCLITIFENHNHPKTQEVINILNKGLEHDKNKRAEISYLIEEINNLLTNEKEQKSQEKNSTSSKSVWIEGDEVTFKDQNYKILQHLGTGGIGSTYLVQEINKINQETYGTYVAKIIRSKADGDRIIQAYRRVKPYVTRNEGFSAIYDISTEWQENEIFALLTWIKGEPLSSWIGYFQNFVTSFSVEEVEQLVFSWVKDICTSLEILHKNDLIHGDISPKNIILDKDKNDKPVLTDYDFVTKTSEIFDRIGSPMYSAYHPEEEYCSPADDFYALAASIFHIVYNTEPFPYINNMEYDKSQGVQWKDNMEDLYKNITKFINKATDPNPKNRFQSCAEVIEFINSVTKEEMPEKTITTDETTTLSLTSDQSEKVDQFEEPTTLLTPQTNVWLKNLLTAYPGSKYGNPETRGLDSDFAKETYIETKLEKSILDGIKTGKVKLTILCGNAGDGKTALLQHLATALKIPEKKSADRLIIETLPDGTEIYINFDGSAAYQNKSSDQLLDEFFAPFLNQDINKKMAYFLAINDGRLYEWLENQKPSDFVNQLKSLLDGVENNNDHEKFSDYIRFINLNHRSLVGSIDNNCKVDYGFLNELIDKLYGGECAPQLWEGCKSCTVCQTCDVYNTMQVFGPDSLISPENQKKRDWARKRLFDALQAVHFQGKTHITMRELRAAVIYILFGTLNCKDYQSDVQINNYWDRAFDNESQYRQVELLKELVNFDPALDSNVKIDLYLTSTHLEEDIVAPYYPELSLASARRRAYFEWTEEDINKVMGNNNNEYFGLYSGKYLDMFKNIPFYQKHDKEKYNEILQSICKGISLLEDLPTIVSSVSKVALKVIPRTPTETVFWVEKKLEQFSIDVDLPKSHNDMDVLHRGIFLNYKYENSKNKEVLRINYKLFYLLMEISEGYQLGDISSDDTFSNLSIFVKRLIRENARELYAWNPLEEHSIFKISAKEGFDHNNNPIQVLQLDKVN